MTLADHQELIGSRCLNGISVYKLNADSHRYRHEIWPAITLPS